MMSVCKYLIIFLLTSSGMIHLMAQEPFILQQEMIKKGEKVYSGMADFKFAVVSDQTTLWSNDATSFNASEPLSSVQIEVNEGVFSAILGEAPMSPFYYELLKLYPKASLLTWVNTGSGFTLMNEQSIDPSIYTMLLEQEPAVRKHQPAPLLYAETKDKSKKEKKPKEAMNPEEWMVMRYKQRADSSGKVPMDGLLKAKKHIEQMPSPKDIWQWSWEWLGPSNIGGRIRAIAIHPSNPNTMFIGGVSGGIWKSTNGGSSWTVVNDFLPSLAISSIVYDPANTSIMYAGTGEGFYNADALPGAGIFKSTNGGTTWTQLASTNNNDFKYVNRLAHHPDSTGVIYAATRDPHRVWKSKNGGTTWTAILSATYGVCDIRVSPHGTHNNLVAGCWGHGSASWTNSGEVYTSSNWGKTWTEQTTGAANKLPIWPQRCEVTFCQNHSTRIYIVCGKSNGEVWRSDDLGTTWTLRGTPAHMGSQQWYNNCIWVDPTNSDRLVIGGIDNYRSTNGGTSFTKISDWTKYHNNSSANSAHADNHIIIHHPNFNGTTNTVVFFGNDGGIQKATDILTTTTTSGWVNLAGTSLGITQFYGVAAAPDGSYIIGGTQDNDHLRYMSSGTWSGPDAWFQEETGDGGYAAIDYNNPLIHYSEYTHLVIQKSSNGGNSNGNAITGLSIAGNDDSTLFISPFSMDPNNPAILIAGGTSMWRTTNSAGSWSKIRGAQSGTPKCSAIDIAKGNSDIIWLGYEDGHVAKTTNGTAASPTWVRVDNNPTALPNRYVTDIAINPNNHNEVFVTFGGYYSNNVWYTSNGGTGWSNRSGTAPYTLPALQINTVRIHPVNGNWVYIGSDLGLFSSEDKGLKWNVEPSYSPANNELPANVEVHELCWQGDDYLIAATFGRGMYRAQPLRMLYVDLTAPAGGNGTLAAPFNNVTSAVNVMLDGTIILIKSNVYDESNPLLINKKGFIITSNGTTVIK